MARVNTSVVHLTELGKGIVQITMRDEQYRNTFSQALIDGLYECFGQVARHHHYKVVILTGYDSYFCSGGTKEELIRLHRREIRFDALDFFHIALDCKLPVISAMQGHGIGGGFVLGLYGDMVVLGAESIYTTNFMRYGFTPGMGCTLIVPEKLGTMVGTEMMYTAENYRGQELADRGIPLVVVPRKEVLNHAITMAEAIAEKPRLSLITLKEHLTADIRRKLPQWIAQEVAMHDITFHQPEVADLINTRFGESSGQFTEDKQENILSQLQLGEISLEQAESLLLDNSPDSTTILSQLQLGEISLEQAEALLLDNPTDSTALLSQLQLGEISLEQAEALLLDNSPIKGEILVTGERADENPPLPNVPHSPPASTDIAIIGISCRYPGAKNWQEFWENLKNGVDSITEVPPEKWADESWYNPDPNHPHTSYSKWSGFIDDVDKFDPFFFQISPTEAQYMEPQHRIFLEEAYHAIEDAGYAADSLKGKPCGVFVGAANGDYAELLFRSGLYTNRQVLTGNSVSVLPARIAYFLDLRGAVMAIETACSSSLVAIHQACESINRGECEMALAGGITLMLTPTQNIVTSQYKMLSPQGRCRTFDAAASGIVWSEGCGIVVLKGYEQAVKDGDRIYAIIKGSGINYDGKTNGITAPSSQSQVNLEKKIYEKLGINPATIGYVEAHGTGTPLGDPIEVGALTEVFSSYTDRKQFCPIGSVKTNIGHTAWAAGVASVIKSALCLYYRQLVPSLHFQEPNPHIDFAQSQFYVNTEYKSWDISPGEIRRVAVSSLGFSGTNAHAVLEEAPSVSAPQKPPKERPFHLLTLSAKSETSLMALIESYQNYLATSTVAIADICYTANTGRSTFTHRLALVATHPQEFAQKLRDYHGQKTTPGVFAGKVIPSSRAPIAFLCTGQGSQYVQMGRQLYDYAPVFRQAIDECDRILQPLLKKSLISLLYPQHPTPSHTTQLDQTGYTQPALFAVEYALAKLWQSWGIQPDILIGHSVGEYVAATLAGVWSLADGLRLITTRGRLMQQLPPGGVMVAVMASEETVNQLLQSSRMVAIAANNGPESVVISGEKTAVNSIIHSLEARGIKTKPLSVSHAFHSPLMEPMLAAFAAVAHQLTYHPPQIPLISNVTGNLIGNEIATAQYWVNHISQPVQFAQGMQCLHQQGYHFFLEIGPQPILLGMGRKCLPPDAAATAQWLPSLRRGVDEWQQILSTVATLYTQGFSLDWLGLDKDDYRQKVTLPNYPFERQRYWIETTPTTLPSIPAALPSLQSSQNTEILSRIQPASLETETSPEMIGKYLEERARQILNISPHHTLHWQQSILDLGFDSLSAVELLNQIRTDLGVSLETSEMMSGPSIAQLATQLTELLQNQPQGERKKVEINASSWFAYYQPKPDALLRLFCFHPWGGSAAIFQHWSKQLPEIEVLPIQLPGRQQRIKEKFVTDFSELIFSLAQLVKEYQDQRVAFFGHSMGAIIAFEVAHYLEQVEQIKLDYLCLSGAKPPTNVEWLTYLASLSEEEKLDYFLKVAEIPPAIQGDRPLLDELIKIFKADIQLIESYQYSDKVPLHCPIHGFRGIDDPIVSEAELLQWSTYTTKSVQIHSFPGQHMFLKQSESQLLETLKPIFLGSGKNR